jgi:hypothetical protein
MLVIIAVLVRVRYHKRMRVQVIHELMSARQRAAIDRALRSERSVEERAADIVSELHPVEGASASERDYRLTCALRLADVLTDYAPTNIVGFSTMLLHVMVADADVGGDLGGLLGRLFVIMGNQWPASAGSAIPELRRPVVPSRASAGRVAEVAL